jgi:hypothetical protein
MIFLEERERERERRDNAYLVGWWLDYDGSVETGGTRIESQDIMASGEFRDALKISRFWHGNDITRG